MPKWFAHFEIMVEYHMTEKVSRAEVSEARVRGEQDWIDSVKFTLGSRGMCVETVIMGEG